LELANFLCKIRFLEDLDIKIFKTKNLNVDDWLSWTVALGDHVGAGLWKARFDVTVGVINLEDVVEREPMR